MKPSAPRPIPSANRAHAAQDSGQATTSDSRSGMGDFLTPGQPIILRLPRGLAAMLVLLLVVAVIVAYMVGRSQGYRAGQGFSQEPVVTGPTPGDLGVPMGTVTNPGPGTPGTRSTATNPGNTVATTPGTTTATTPGTSAHPPAQIQLVELPGSADARVKGLNYFVKNESEANAIRLVHFLWTNGVEAQAVKRHNSSLFQVVFLQGFDRTEINSPRQREYERVLKQLGKAWKAQTPGATDLEQIYLDRYDGEQELKVITVKRQ